MARNLVLSLDGKLSAFSFAKLERRKLYGTRKREAVDRDGQRCSRAKLTTDGRFLLQAGMMGRAYFTQEGTWVPQGELVGRVS